MADRIPSELVQHGIRSWVDYSKPWLARRQFLVTDYHADVLTSALSVCLTLTAPRIWVLLRAFVTWMTKAYVNWQLRRKPTNKRQPEQFGDIPLRDLLEHNLSLTTDSHTELTAARIILNEVLQNFRNGKISLEDTPDNAPKTVPRSLYGKFRGCTRKLADVILPLLLAALLVGLFVAQSTTAVLSAGIFGDTMALMSNPNCSDLFPSLVNVEGLDYWRDCYDRTRPSRDCSLYANLTVGYNTTWHSECFLNGTACLYGFYSFDTGPKDAKMLGINTSKTYYFRRRMKCTHIANPLMVCDSRKGSLAESKASVAWNEPETEPDTSLTSPQFESWSCIRPSVSTYQSSKSLDDTQLYLEINTFKKCPPNPLEAGCFKFPYLSHIPEEMPLCVQEAEFCIADGYCLSVAPVIYQFWDGAFGPTYRVIDDIFSSSSAQNPESKLSETLLHAILVGEPPSTSQFSGEWQNIMVPFLAVPLLDSENIYGKSLQLWELTLASLQVHPSEIVRNQEGSRMTRDSVAGLEIPEDYRGICNMIKFRTLGWRNVSTWGIIGIPFLALLLSLGSIRTSDHQFWLILTLQKLWAWTHAGLGRILMWLRKLTHLYRFSRAKVLDPAP